MAAKPGVIELAWAPAKADCVRAVVTMTSKWMASVAVCQVMSARLVLVCTSSGWDGCCDGAVRVELGSNCSSSGA